MKDPREAQLFKHAAVVLRKVASERDEAVTENVQLKLKVAAYERFRQAEKVAAMMHQKGINIDTEFPALVADLEKAAQEGRLPVIEEAVSMAGANMGIKTASINETQRDANGSDLERYLFGSIGSIG